MGDLPLRTPIDHRLGAPLLHQLANLTHAHPSTINVSYKSDATLIAYAVLIRVSPGYAPLIGRLHTRYAPVRH